MHRWELSDVLPVGFVLAVAALLVGAAACFGLGALVMVRGGLPAVLVRRAPDSTAAAGVDPTVVTGTAVLTPTLSPVPFSTPAVTFTLAAPAASPGADPFFTATPPAFSATARPGVSPGPAGTGTPTPVVWPSDTPVVTTATEVPTLPPEVGGDVIIVEVNKLGEWVTLGNMGVSPIDLTGWKIVSENGSETCDLVDLVLTPEQDLRIWTMAQNAQPGDATCDRSAGMWSDTEPDAAALYNAQGQLVDRYIAAGGQ
jgi:hypothetical protein